VEYAVLVAVTFTFCLVVNRKIIFEKYRIIPFIARSVGFLLLVIAALWIGGIIKLTLVKNYLFFAYFTIVRGGEYGSGNFVDAWSRRFTDSPVICIFALATIIYIVCTYKKHTTLLPYLVYPLLVLITSLRNTSISPTYVSSIFPPIFLLSGIALFEMSKGKRVVFPLLITIVIALSSAFFLRPPAIFSSGSGANKINRGLVAFFKTEHRADSNIVVPRIYLPTLHYYNSDKHFAAYAEEFDDSTKIIELLSRTSANGFLCIGRNPERWRTMLQNNYIVKTDSLQYDSHDKDHIIYYELRRL
jgi:hypothetical protein